MKEPQEPRQITFFDTLVSNGGDVKAAAEEAEYERSYAYQLAKKYHEYLTSRVQGAFYLDTVRAHRVFSDALTSDGSIVGEKTRMDAAKDRSGIVKQESIKVTVDTPNGVFILPAKDIDPDRKNG